MVLSISPQWRAITVSSFCWISLKTRGVSTPGKFRSTCSSTISTRASNSTSDKSVFIEFASRPVSSRDQCTTGTALPIIAKSTLRSRFPLVKGEPPAKRPLTGSGVECTYENHITPYLHCCHCGSSGQSDGPGTTRRISDWDLATSGCTSTGAGAGNRDARCIHRGSVANRTRSDRAHPAPGTTRADAIRQFGQRSVTVTTRIGETLYFDGGRTIITLENGQVSGPK